MEVKSEIITPRQPDIFEAELKAALEIESQQEARKSKSFCQRAFRLKLYGNKTLVRQEARRSEN